MPRRKKSSSSSSSSSTKPKKRKVRRTKVPRKPTTSPSPEPKKKLPSSSSSDSAGLADRLRKLKPRKAKDPNNSDDEYISEELQELAIKLQKMLSTKSRDGALRCAMRLLERGAGIDPEHMLTMLENAATIPGTELFAYTLHCTVIAGGLHLTPEEYLKILGIMVFRHCPVPQIRAFLNVALPKEAKTVPVIPDDVNDAEADQMFRDTRAAREDFMTEEPVEDEDSTSKQAPSTITMKGCRAIPELNGRYVLCFEHSMPGRPVYQKEIDVEMRSDSEDEEVEVYVSYRAKEEAWVMSKGYKGPPLMKNERQARAPPGLGWEVTKEGCKGDAGSFLKANGSVEEEQPKRAPKKARTDVLSSRQALDFLDLKKLKGHIACNEPYVAEYFGHFVVLAHLEHLEDVQAIKRRRERSSADQLVRWGYAVSGLKVENVFGRKEAGHRAPKTLPGWEEVGTEMVAFELPYSQDIDRTRLRRGDSVTISNSDPMKDRVAEGSINDIRQGTLVVQVRGRFTEDDGRWRVDKSANSTVYERQMWALLGLSHAVRSQPTVELLTAAPVGMADRWTMHWTGRQDRSRRHASRSRSRDGSPELEKRRKRCIGLAMSEVHDPARLERLDEAQREVDEVEDLNDSQRHAIQGALSRTCTVIQGPPGTGKTSVSVQILNFWTKIMNLTPVLATSDSNIAVDNICEGLRSEGVKAVRVGRAEKIRGVVEEMTLEAELKRLKELMEGKEKSSDEEEKEKSGRGKGGGKSRKKKEKKDGAGRPAMTREDFELQMEILKKAEVICTTTIAGGMDFLKQLSNFEAILVDEVAQATELSTLVPVVLRGATRLVLVGDHCQLPPSVQSAEAELRGMSVSVYSRLVEAGGVEPFLLDTQYRSHPKLAQFSSEAFYDGMVKSGIKESKRPAPRGVPWPNKDCPIAFINVDAEEELEGDSKANGTEAKMVADLVGQVFEYGELTVSQVGVVTPYMAQVRRLRQLLRNVLPKGADARLMECASVDNFQGREKELIVFSAVRSNSRGNVGFLADWRRLNVMLTRARRGLIIFGNAQTLKNDPVWKRWLDFAERHDCMVRDLTVDERPPPEEKEDQDGRGQPARKPLLALEVEQEDSKDGRKKMDLRKMAMKSGVLERAPHQQLQQIHRLEARINEKKEELEAKKMVASQLLFVNPITAQQQIQEAQQSLNELARKGVELADWKKDVLKEIKKEKAKSDAEQDQKEKS